MGLRNKGNLNKNLNPRVKIRRRKVKRIRKRVLQSIEE
jgi:hypothetical protein